MGTGRMTKLMVMVFIHIWMERDMKEIGRKISSMVKGLNPGQMVLTIKGAMLREENMVLEFLLGQIKVHMRDNSLKIILKVKEFINGLMVELMKVIGKIIKWMDREYSHGQMEGNTKESGRMGNNME